MNRVRDALLSLTAFCIVAMGIVQGFAASPMQDEKYYWFRDKELRLAYAYNPSRWKEARPAETSTRHAIKWLGIKSGGLVATCYLQTFSGSEFASLTEDQIHPSIDGIVLGAMANAHRRDPAATLVTKQATYADNYPVILLERRFRARSLNLDTTMTLVGVFTAWREYEVNFECGFSDAVRQNEKVYSFVRKEIMRVLRTLHFER